MIENNNMDTNKEISSSVSQQYPMNASLSNTSSTPGANIIPSTSNPVTTDGKHPFSASQPSLTSMDYDDDYEKRVNKQRGIVNYTSSYHADIEEGADTNGTGRSFFVNRDDNDDFDVNNNRSKMSFVFSNIRIILVSFFLCVIGFICLVVAIAVSSVLIRCLYILLFKIKDAE